jgi:hypothetical protein
MGLLRRLGLAGALVALGAVLATTDVGGKTALRHLGDTIQGPVWQALKSGAGSLYERARTVVGVGKPVEHHSPEDREALNKLIAKRAQP